MDTSKFANRLESEFDREFLKRVYSDGIDKYKKRLKAIDFQANQKVLDAGCGFGQWTFALSQLNQFVLGIDSQPLRINICRQIQEDCFPTAQIDFRVARLEETTLPSDSFDLIFCYSVIYITDFRKTLQEFYRLLKSGGKVYICANDIGWYLYNLQNEHNCTSDFSSKHMAVETLKHTIQYYISKTASPGKQIIMPVDYTLNFMSSLGFKNIVWDGEGLINLTNECDVLPFYEKFFNGEINIYELIGEK